MLLSLVIPCYNEEGNVEKFFCEVKKTFDSRSEEIEYVFVDDGSSDFTFNKLQALYDSHAEEKIQVLSFSRNFGKEAAMYAGLSHAKGDLVCIIDADLQQRPEVVAQMLDILEKNPEYDCVAAYQETRSENKLIASLKSLFYNGINKITDVEFKNGASDFRLMRKNMVKAILSMKEYHRFSKGIFAFVGFKTEFIPYTAADRESGQSKWNFSKLLRYALEGIISFSSAPLKFALWSGCLTLVAALVCIILAVAFGANLFTPAFCAVLSLVLGGTILMSLGIVGAYLSRAYDELRHRPVYILKTHLRREENGKNQITDNQV